MFVLGDEEIKESPDQTLKFHFIRPFLQTEPNATLSMNKKMYWTGELNYLGQLKSASTEKSFIGFS